MNFMMTDTSGRSAKVRKIQCDLEGTMTSTISLCATGREVIDKIINLDLRLIRDEEHLRRKKILWLEIRLN